MSGGDGYDGDYSEYDEDYDGDDGDDGDDYDDYDDYDQAWCPGTLSRFRFFVFRRWYWLKWSIYRRWMIAVRHHDPNEDIPF